MTIITASHLNFHDCIYSLIGDTVTVPDREAADNKHEGFMPADTQMHDWLVGWFTGVKHSHFSDFGPKKPEIGCFPK